MLGSLRSHTFTLARTFGELEMSLKFGRQIARSRLDVHHVQTYKAFTISINSIWQNNAITFAKGILMLGVDLCGNIMVTYSKTKKKT